MKSGRLSRPKKRGRIYEEPRLYDLAFSFRDISEECDGLIALARAHGVDSPKRVLEIACGPGHHLREFVKRGMGAVGVDLNTTMLGYAKRLAKVDDVAVEFRRADMRSFRLAKRVDIAMCLFDSFAHCTSDEDGIAALRSTGSALRSGGLFVLELTHPADYFDPDHGRTLGHWTQRHPGVVLDARYETSARDAVAETYRATMTIEARYSDGRRSRKIVGKQLHRMWLRGSVSNIAARSGVFDVVGWYGDLDVGVPFTMKMDSWRMVAVMRRR